MPPPKGLHEKQKDWLIKYWEKPENREKQSRKLSEFYENHPEEREKARVRSIKQFTDPKQREKDGDTQINRFKDPKERARLSEMSKKYWKKPESHLKASEGQKRRFEKPGEFEKNSKSQRKRFENPIERAKNKKHPQEYFKDPKNCKKASEMQRRIQGTPEARQKASCSMRLYYQNTPNAIERNIEAHLKARIDHSWITDIKYFGDNDYCELWTPDLRRRIRAYWCDKSTLSGKTKMENNNRKLSCHHVYYQEKACCVWDEDAQGYYAWIDVGTLKEPNKIKHYIKGDPNKFVALTGQEHGWMKTNKMKWIGYFEDLIEKIGVKCYYTKEEWNEIIEEQKQVIKNTIFHPQITNA